jgi:hypothetical protein
MLAWSPKSKQNHRRIISLLRTVTFCPGLAAGELRFSRFGQSFRARHLRFRLVVGMDHDQGHGLVKVLGIEVGASITVGLPVIRTSVDHGTAFDIAGQEKRTLEAWLRQSTRQPRWRQGLIS